jgi:signal transduction histidine kinase
VESFDTYCVVRVADTGAGIAEEHLDKLFYPFFTTKKQGSGVGLSMAKKIVDSHRGLIDVASRAGEGTVFTVRLPVVPTGAAETVS